MKQAPIIGKRCHAENGKKSGDVFSRGQGSEVRGTAVFDKSTPCHGRRVAGQRPAHADAALKAPRYAIRLLPGCLWGRGKDAGRSQAGMPAVHNNVGRASLPAHSQTGMSAAHRFIRCWALAKSTTSRPLRLGKGLDCNLDLPGLDGERHPLLGTHFKACGDGILDIAQGVIMVFALADASRNGRTLCNPDAVFIAKKRGCEFHADMLLTTFRNCNSSLSFFNGIRPLRKHGFCKCGRLWASSHPLFHVQSVRIPARGLLLYAFLA